MNVDNGMFLHGADGTEKSVRLINLCNAKIFCDTENHLSLRRKTTLTWSSLSIKRILISRSRCLIKKYWVG